MQKHYGKCIQNDMKKIDVLWLLEHKVREMDIACAVKSLIQKRYGLDITIQNIYLHTNDAMKNYVPQLVIFPFLYRTSDLAIDDYIQIWPRAIYFNLAWEQVHYKAHLKMKAPGDDFTKRKVVHHAWGEFYKNYLVESGVPPEHVFVNGNPVYQLYKEPYKKYFKPRIELARQYNLDPAKKWVFIPENYKWGFFSDDKLQRSAERGGSLEEHLSMRAFCRESLAHLFRWCNEAGKSDALEIIFRPRPATNSQLMEDFFREHVGARTPHLHFTKAETVRDWILASDVVISSYSTSLIESAAAGKSIYMVEPIPIPESLSCDWYGLVPRIYDSQGFEQACLAPVENNSCDLQRWAESEMLSKGDPIEGLVDFIAKLLRDGDPMDKNRAYHAASQVPVLTSLLVRTKWRSKRLATYSWGALHSFLSAFKTVVLYFISFVKPGSKGQEREHPKQMLSQVKDKLNRMVNLFSQGFGNTNYFNPVTHENDTFTEMDVNKRVEIWRGILKND
jgi:surface carbohydrate biosynthesis protein